LHYFGRGTGDAPFFVGEEGTIGAFVALLQLGVEESAFWTGQSALAAVVYDKEVFAGEAFVVTFAGFAVLWAVGAEFVFLVKVLGRTTGDTLSGVVEVIRIVTLGACMAI